MSHVSSPATAVNLAREVQMRPCLYDRTHTTKLYTCRVVQDQAWIEVGQALGIAPDLARKRWQNIRGSYTKSKSKQALHSTAPRFYLSDHLRFLDPHLMNTPNTTITSSSVGNNASYVKPEPTEEDDDSDNHSDFSLPLGSPESITEFPSSPPSKPQAQPRDHQIIITPDADQNQGPSAKRKRTHSPYPGIEEEEWQDISNSNTASGANTTRKRKRKNNPDSKYLKGLLPQIELLNKRNKWSYFQKINTLLFQMLEKQEEEEERVEGGDT